MSEREESMVRMYGEACTPAVARKILGGVSGWYIHDLTAKGKIIRCCEGNRKVDVRSLCAYIEGRSGV